EERLSYGELNRRANRLAHYLRSQGIGSESLVGICLDRSIEMVVAIIAILKAGGGYVPIDPATPKERIAFILEDAQVSILLTQESFADILDGHKAEAVCLDRVWHEIVKQEEHNLS